MARRVAAMVDERHYTAHVGQVKALLRSGDDDAAAGLLLRLIDAVDREAQIPLAGCAGVPGWYFEQLATIYSRQGMLAERALLVQRQIRLQIQAETQGKVALHRMREGHAATPPKHTAPMKRTSSKPGAAEKTGRAIGGLVGTLLRAVRPK